MLNLDNLHPAIKLRLKRALYSKDQSTSRQLMNISKQIQLHEKRTKSSTSKDIDTTNNMFVSELRDEAINEVTPSVSAVSEGTTSVKTNKKANKLTKLIQDKQ